MASVWAVASVLGPTLGGVFAELGAWRWIFFINVPLSLLAATLVVRGYPEHLERRRHRVDYPGAVALTVGLAALILGILEGGRAWAWASWPSAATFGVAVLALASLALIDRRAAEPVIEFGLLGRRLIVGTSLTMLALGALTVGVTSFAPAYLQTATGLSPIWAGLAVAAMTLGWPLASAASSRFYLARGFRVTILIGAVTALAGSVALAATAHWPSAWTVAGLTFVMSLGLGLTAAPSTIAAQNSVGWEQRGQVTAVNTFSRSAGSAVGVAIFGAISNAVLAAHGGEATATTVVASTQAVFVGVVVAALLVVVAGLILPQDDPRRGARAGVGGGAGR